MNSQMKEPVASPPKGEAAAARLAQLCARASEIGTTPGFLPGASPIMISKAASDFMPAHWSYGQVRLALDDASEVLDPAFAERRSLVLRNPMPGNDWRTSRTMACAYQMMLPGEVARSHRHTSHALRLILDGRDTYSIVDGVRMPMESGDVVLTPGGHWHAHGHEGDAPAYWLDCLDVPLTYLLEPLKLEAHPASIESVSQRVTSSPLRFAWADTVRALENAKADAAGTHGPRILLPTPEMPSLQLSMERLERGAATRAKRSAANRIFCVVDGEGRSEIGGSVFNWSRGDTFVAPLWNAIRHFPQRDSVLLEMSDQPVMEFVKYYREEIV